MSASFPPSRGSTDPGPANTHGQKTIAIVQSSYIPWKGYFDLIARADEFVLLDSVQYTRRDWRNRNLIKTAQGLAWLSIPVQAKGRYTQRICDTVVSDPDWAQSHWASLRRHYARAEHFRDYQERFESLYLGCQATSLSEINHRFLTAICETMGIATPITWSMDYAMVDGASERLVSICRQSGATRYLSGPSAAGYLDASLFEAAGVAVEYMDYSGYPEYRQLYPPFAHNVSIVDLVFSEGPDARRFLKG